MASSVGRPPSTGPQEGAAARVADIPEAEVGAPA